MPIIRRNKWSDNAADIEDAQLQTAASIDRVVDVIGRVANKLPDPDIFEQTGYAVARAAQQITIVATETARTAAAVEAIAQQRAEQEQKDTDTCTALYAAAVDVSGKFVRRTDAGKLLLDAKYESLADLAKRGREAFICDIRAALARLAGAAGRGGVIAVMRDEELGYFYDRAPAVLKAIALSHNK